MSSRNTPLSDSHPWSLGDQLQFQLQVPGDTTIENGTCHRGPIVTAIPVQAICRCVNCKQYHDNLPEFCGTDCNQMGTAAAPLDGLSYMPAYLRLGMSPGKQRLVFQFAQRVNDSIQMVASKDIGDADVVVPSPNIIEIGSGRGYLSRILVNYYHYRLYCVDLDSDASRRSLNLQRLIKEDDISEVSRSKRGINLSNANDSTANMKIARNGSIDSYNKFASTINESFHFFKLYGVNNNNNSVTTANVGDQSLLNVSLIGLSLCGDFPRNLFHWIRQYNEDKLNKLVNITRVMMVPCCYHKMGKLEITSDHGDLDLYGETYRNFQLYDLQRLLTDEYGYVDVNLEVVDPVKRLVMISYAPS